MEHPIHSFMKISMENIKEMVDVDTIVGQPVSTKEGATIIPISKVKFSFASGGTEQKVDKPQENIQGPFGGGSGGTVSITPIAFLVVNNDNDIRVLSLENQTHIYEKLIDFVPELLQKIKLVTPKMMNGMKRNKPQEELNP
ncbi:MAG TPA: GerW family sporulation protein [Haloplasmataceae bacterium]